MSSDSPVNELNLEDLTKEELLEKVQFWEGKFHVVDGNYKKLNERLDTEIEKRKEVEAAATSKVKETAKPSDELSQIQEENKQMRILIQQALDGLKTVTEQVNCSSEFNNKQKIDAIDQYMRRNSLMWKGIVMPANLYGIDFIKHLVEEINRLFPNLSHPVEVHHIDDAHPLKTQNGDTLIISKFNCRWLKNEIYKSRSLLKQTDVVVFEQLTTNTQNLLTSVKSMVGKDTKVYTNNCVINFKFNNRKYHIKTYKDVQYVAKKLKCVTPPPPPGFQAIQNNFSDYAPFHNQSMHSGDGTDQYYNTDNSFHPMYFKPYTQPPYAPPQGRGRGRGASVAHY